MKKLFEEFKSFIMKGNALDLAIGVIIGSAFGSVVNGVVNDLLMPPLGLLLGNVNFSDLYIQLNRKAVELAPQTTLAAAKEQGATLAYGNFITILINFLILAFIIFLMVRYVGKVTAQFAKKEEEAAPAGPTEIELLAEIRDALKK